MTLADVIRNADKELEPARNQQVVVDGCEVLMLVCLDLTAVIEHDGRKVLVRHALVEIPDPSLLSWQKKASGRAVHMARLALHRKPGAGPR